MLQSVYEYRQARLQASRAPNPTLQDKVNETGVMFSQALRLILTPVLATIVLGGLIIFAGMNWPTALAFMIFFALPAAFLFLRA